MNGLLRHQGASAAALADALAELLAQPRTDPFATDLVCVPGAGLQRWLAQHLARRLGPPGQGICAGVEFLGLDALIARLRRTLTDEPDPWRPERLAWILRTVLAASTDPALERLRAHVTASREPIAVLGRVAGLFARYADWRAPMLADWLVGNDVDPDGVPLAVDAWQPVLWRLAVAQIGTHPGEPRRLLAELARSRPDDLQLPAQISVFAPAQLSPWHVELLQSLATEREVHLWLVRSDQSPTPHHPLNERLGRQAREARFPAGTDVPVPRPEPEGGTILSWLAADVAADRSPDATRTATRADRSVQVHACHGLDRQVEVLRDAITRLLEEDPTLEPRDVVIGCADLDAATPLIHAAFGLPESVHARHPARTFRVQVADRTAAQVNPLVGVLRRILSLATARADTAELLELCAQPAVAARFGLFPDDVERAFELVERAGIKWGLSARHRRSFGLETFPHNTWAAGLRRLLLGIALGEDGLPSVGTTFPVDDVDSSDVALLGSLCELISRLSRIALQFEAPATPAEWVERLRNALDLIALCAGDTAWQRTHAWLGLGGIAERGGAATLLTLPEIERLVADEFTAAPARPPFGNGSLTVCALSSLRHIPHRVVCLLGLDDGTFPRAPGRDGDDLMLRSPRPGDPDVALHDRQLLLDAVLAAGEHLVITYRGRNPATNEPVEPPAALVDLLEALDQTATREDGALLRSQVVTEHRLQPFDPAYFGSGPLWSYDPVGLRGAQALAGGTRTAVPDPAVPPAPDLDSVTLAGLTAFLSHPAKYFLRTRTGLVLTAREIDPPEIPIELTPLQRWEVGARVLKLTQAGNPVERVTDVEWLRGSLPPGQLGIRIAEDVKGDVRQVLRALPAAAGAPTEVRDIAVDVSGVRVSGRLRVQAGTLLTTEISRLQAKHRLGAWARLVLARAAGLPVTRATVVARGNRCAYRAPTPERARALLAELLDLHRAGLDRALPLPPRVAEAIVLARAAGQDPFDPKIKRLDQPWEFDSDENWTMFFPDLHALRAVPHDDPTRFGHPGEPCLIVALARRVWEPMLEHEVDA